MRTNLGIKGKFLLVNLAVYLVIGAIAFAALRAVVTHVADRLGLAYAGKYALASSVLLREPLDREIALARLMADSPVIREWVRDEHDDAKRQKAWAELQSYGRKFADRSWFLVVNSTLNYYFNDALSPYPDGKPAYSLSPEAPKDAWYFATVQDVSDFAVNVNRDSVLDKHKVWINVMLRKPDGTIEGMAGTGLDLSEFLRVTVDNTEPGVQNILLDRRLAIQAHRDRSLIDQQSVAKSQEALSTITRLVENSDELINMQAALIRIRDKAPSETFYLTLNGRRHLVGAAYVPSLQWYVLSVLDLNEVIGRHLFLPILALGLLFAILIFLVVGMTTNRLLLKPISKVTVAAQRLADGDYSVSLLTPRNDEIGTLTRTFSQMSDKVRDYTDNLEQRIEERTVQLNESNKQLQENMEKLEQALKNVRTLEGILPICAACKKIRDDKGYWTQVEAYVTQHSQAAFTHSICPDCFKTIYPTDPGRDKENTPK